MPELIDTGDISEVPEDQQLDVDERIPNEDAGDDIADPDVITVGQKLTIPGGAKSKRETVSLARVRRAARRDPRAPSDTFTAQADVMVVEHALKAEGLLNKPWVDGHFGTLTIKAYSAWQRRCGYSGQDADGVPGEASLTKLGKPHGFDVK